MNQVAFFKAAEKTGNGEALQQAVAAGIPWEKIFVWIFTYGPELARVIEELIERFKKDPAHSPAPENAGGE